MANLGPHYPVRSAISVVLADEVASSVSFEKVEARTG